jgi:RHS repeat-associated protein
MDNLRTSSIGAAGFTYQYDVNNQLYRVDRSGGGAYNYTFDVRGNVSNDGRNAYNFTRANRLASVTGKDSYQYDGHGRRLVVWRADGTAQVPVYNLNGQLRFTADNRLGGGTTSIYLGGSVIAESVQIWATGVSTVTYLHTDSLGSPVVRTDASKNVMEKTEFAPYGAPVNRPVDGVGYTGHVMDQSDGLIYMQQRYYDPLVGRFISSDPILPSSDTSANFNRYWYANNNPFRFTDPDGRLPGGCDSGVGGCSQGSFFVGDAPARVRPSKESETPKEPRAVAASATPSLPNPNGVIPGGPWEPQSGQRPGAFQGPKPPGGGRPMAQWVPPEGQGGPPGSRGYWKFKLPNGPWQRFTPQGAPQTAEEAHPSSRSSTEGRLAGRLLPIVLSPVVVFIVTITYSPGLNENENTFRDPDSPRYFTPTTIYQKN